MKRKILLALLSAAVLVGAFGLYHYVAKIQLHPTPSGRDGVGDVTNDDNGQASGDKKPKVVELDVSIAGKDGRIASRYRALKITKNADGSYSVIEPHFERYEKNGQIVSVQA
ncbi:MAG TPA: hypothetical protein ENL03_01010, partial [Phycisphaerae bacterium]|nr:hypothetical protein [Phycisphaerae bacterium]